MRKLSVKMRNIREKKSELKEKSKILRKFIKKDKIQLQHI